MSLFVYLNGSNVDVSRIRLRANGDQGVSQLTQSADGNGSQGSITFEDPTYDLTVQGWYPVAVDEPDCTTAPRLFTGYVADQTYSRGHYLLDDDRQIDTTINDTNVLLSAPIFTATDANRPAETGTARLNWLLGSTSPLYQKVWDLGLVNSVEPHYDATNFIGQTPFDVLNDLAGARADIFFTYWDQTQKKIGLYYDLPDATSFTSTLTFSNVLSDISFANGEPTGTCFPAFDIQMESDPSEVYCQLRYVYAFGVVLLHNDTTHTTYFSGTGQGIPAVGHRGTQVEWDKVGKASTATTFGNRLLTHYSRERRVISFTTRLPSSKVGLVQAGHRVGLRFIHLPEAGATPTSTYYRIESIQYAPMEGDPSQYEVQIKASITGFQGNGGSGGGSVFPHGQSPATYVQRISRGNADLATGFQTPTAGHLLTMWIGGRSSAGTPPASTGTWTNDVEVRVDNEFAQPGSYGDLYHKTATGTETVTTGVGGNGVFDFIEWGDGVTFDTFVSRSHLTPNTAINCGGAITPSATGAYVVGCAVIGNFGTGSQYTVTAASGVTEIAGYIPNSVSNDVPSIWVGDVPAAPSGSTTVSATLGGSLGGDGTHGNWAGVTFSVVSSSASNPPQSGQWVYGETPTPAPGGGRVTFSTAFPFADGSLKVYVDHVDETPAILSEDGANQTFTLNFDPRSYETLLVDYQGIG